ncbi:hypothetical protein M8312_09075 [Sphingomonas sp. KRR8]|uniref:hypothetical protein n=1 Tax=Sphingomonas sp. KRR8 TaxID=2942996 RepID=UPI0020225FCF|nr:hypothetical protein [Sphingomonas sp. KRR8]URD59956.1 hypothetical protein M8312_09075 [Sphingomonas sp. KRR8]
MSANAERWRGECIQQFCELETMVEDLLQDLHRDAKQGSKVKVGQMVGPAFGHLRELTGSKGPFAAKGQAISETLAELASWVEWRAHLTHGVMTVWRGRDEQWLLALAHRTPGDPTLRTHALTWKAACSVRELMTKQIEKLRGNARSLANSVAQKA